MTTERQTGIKSLGLLTFSPPPPPPQHPLAWASLAGSTPPLPYAPPFPPLLPPQAPASAQALHPGLQRGCLHADEPPGRGHARRRSLPAHCRSAACPRPMELTTSWQVPCAPRPPETQMTTSSSHAWPSKSE
ncbi:hypothetical protein VPH35_092148 [Triticum aestivum]